MKNVLFFQMFECVTVIFETFIVFQYINGLFDKRQEEKNPLLWYMIFCFGLMLTSLFINLEIILTIYILIGIYILSYVIYRTSILSRIFSVFYFSAIMTGSEIFTSGLISDFLNTGISDALEYGMPRVFSIIVAKLIQVLLVKISIHVAKWKTDQSHKGEPKLIFPLLVCQVFSIITAYFVYKICYVAYHSFEPLALCTMVGIVYMNIVLFWYFDRVKAAFELQNKNEAAEHKLELQKRYYETLRLHQIETDRLWHDMKKHINLMKTLINNGQNEITSEYIHELEAQMDDKIKIIRTDYPVLSALLTEYKQRTKKENILFDIDVRIESYTKIAPVDLCVILGNLYDNALAACMLLTPVSKRIIRTSITQRNNVFAIKMENSYLPNVTTKRRTGKHGLGLKNIKKVLANYNGKMNIVKENEFFIVLIVIP